MKNRADDRRQDGKRKQSPGSPARGDSRPTAPDAAAQRPYQRRELVAILEEYGVSVAVFEGLRSDAYEKHLAGRSLAELEAFYDTLLNTTEHCESIRKKCPKWAGGKNDGKYPSTRTLGLIKRRIVAEETFNGLDMNEQFQKVFRARLKGLPVERQAAMYDTVLELLGNELLSAKLEGKPILKNLPGVDRLIKVAAGKARMEQADTRNPLKEEIQGGRLQLAREKFAFQVKQARPEPEPEEEENVETEGESGMTEDEKSAALLKRAFGITMTSHQRKLRALQDVVPQAAGENADPASDTTPGVPETN